MRVRNILRGLGGALVAIAIAMPASAQSFHFENGNLSGWLQGGTAFRNQPTFGNNIAARRPGESPGHDGEFWIGSFEDRNSPSQPLGQVQGDEPQGTLISPLFTIRDNNISLLVGGGNDPVNLRVDLLVEPGAGETIDSDGSHYGSGARVPEGVFVVRRTATGADQEQMRRVEWDTRSLIGRRARLMIVDSSSRPWGHINVDDVRPGNAIVGSGDPPRAVVVPGRPPMAYPVGPTGGVPAGPPVAYPVGPVVAYPVGPPVGPAIAVPVGPPTPYPVTPPVAYPVGGGPVVARPAPPPPPDERVLRPGGVQYPGGVISLPPTLGRLNETSGHFRVVVTGFRVNRQTDDDALQRDGVGDEIYIRGDTFFLNDRRAGFGGRSARTGMYGQGGFQGGSAGPPWGSAGEERGGLLSGDAVPPGNLFGTALARERDMLPLVLFDGVLERGGIELAIVPSIWEWDGAYDGPTKDAYDQEVSSRINSNTSALPRPITGFSDEHGLPLIEDLASPLDVFDEGTRPIGAATRGSSTSGTMSLPAILLTFDTARQAVTKQFEDHTPLPIPPGGAIPPAMPLPLGVIPIQMRDIGGRPGYYTLYVRIERIN